MHSCGGKNAAATVAVSELAHNYTTMAKLTTHFSSRLNTKDPISYSVSPW
jgi:hypothetical protein